MAKREAQARSLPSGEEMPATLTSAAEEHAQALREELLKSTELAAKSIVGQTRVEGERRIEVAGRRAQAIAETVSEIERAERALSDRAQAFAEASKALRTELESFASALSQGEERLQPKADAGDKRDLRLVEPPATEARRPETPASGISQFLFSEPDPVDDVDVEAETEAESAEEEPDEEEDDEDDQPPTPDQIRRFFRETEEAEIERAARRGRIAAESERGWFRRFFSAPDARPAREEEPAGEDMLAIEEEVVTRTRRRDRLYTDIGGAIIGLGGAAAVINFVILK